MGGAVGIFVGEFQVAFEQDADFDLLNAGDAPAAIMDGLDKAEFVVGGGVMGVDEVLEFALIKGGVFVREEDGLAGEAMFEGVAGGFGFA